MQISLRQVEIEKAVVDYIADQGITIAKKEVTVNFTAGRGAAGLSAEINIEPLGSKFISQMETTTETSQVLADPEPVTVDAEAKPVKAGGLFS